MLLAFGGCDGSVLLTSRERRRVKEGGCGWKRVACVLSGKEGVMEACCLRLVHVMEVCCLRLITLSTGTWTGGASFFMCMDCIRIETLGDAPCCTTLRIGFVRTALQELSAGLRICRVCAASL
eukprot:scaffold41985_cov21-Tisochrysis_lutea.AAC.5